MPDESKPVRNGKPHASAKKKTSAKSAAKKRAPKSSTKKKSAAKARRATSKNIGENAGEIAKKDAEAARMHRSTLNIVERVLVTQKIVILRHQPAPVEWKVIAERLEIPESTCRYYYREYAEALATARDADREGLRILDETLLMYQEVIELLGEATSKGENWAVKVGAARSLMAAMRDRIELMVAMGRMPRSLQAQNHLVRAQTMLRRFYEVLEQHKASPEMLQALMTVIEERSPEQDVIDASSSLALPSGD